MRFLPSRVSAIVWLQPLESNETLGEIAKVELHKDAMCSFEQI